MTAARLAALFLIIHILLNSTVSTQNTTTDATKPPTKYPTFDPTMDPTNDPTNDPTKDPTTDPTNDPSQDPTADPTSTCEDIKGATDELKIDESPYKIVTADDIEWSEEYFPSITADKWPGSLDSSTQVYVTPILDLDRSKTKYNITEEETNNNCKIDTTCIKDKNDYCCYKAVIKSVDVIVRLKDSGIKSKDWDKIQSYLKKIEQAGSATSKSIRRAHFKEDYGELLEHEKNHIRVAELSAALMEDHFKEWEEISAYHCKQATAKQNAHKVFMKKFNEVYAEKQYAKYLEHSYESEEHQKCWDDLVKTWVENEEFDTEYDKDRSCDEAEREKGKNDKTNKDKNNKKESVFIVNNEYVYRVNKKYTINAMVFGMVMICVMFGIISVYCCHQKDCSNKKQKYESVGGIGIDVDGI